MKWNPFLNALAAAGYIWCVALFFLYMSLTQSDKPDSFAAPVGALSLLVFSVALMAFLFFYHPAVLLMENKRKEAVTYFFKTLFSFGVLAVAAFVLIFFVV